MLAYLHEVVQNHTLISEGVIVQNNSRDRELCFLRVTASSNHRSSKKRLGNTSSRMEADIGFLTNKVRSCEATI